MANLIVIAYHLIWTGYGQWLPNDPRGSGSREVKSDLLRELGELHYGRKKIQPSSREIRVFYDMARDRLKYPLLSFRTTEMQLIGNAFTAAIQDLRYTCYACAIMTDHVHILIRKHKHLAEDMIQNLQSAGRIALRGAGRYGAEHPVFADGGWKVFLDHPDDIRRTIPYINDNPIKAHLPRQNWSFVAPYDGWPLHPGHNPNSPYARGING